LVPIEDTGRQLFYFCFFYNVVLMLLAQLPVAFGIPSLLQKGKQQQYQKLTHTIELKSE
jgi:hypothetical protein